MSKVLVFGSLNIDEVYTLDHITLPGETQSSTKLEFYPGGKGANQAVAVAKAGAQCYHGGKLGLDGKFIVDHMKKANVNCELIIIDEKKASGKAIIQLCSKSGENAIILYPGCNNLITDKEIENSFNQQLFSKHDILVLQNELNCNTKIIEQGIIKEMDIIYNPAPYSNEISSKIAWHSLTIIILNQSEALQLYTYLKKDEYEHKEAWEELGKRLMKTILNLNNDSKLKYLLLTLGSEGSLLFHIEKERIQSLKLDVFKPRNKIKDTTGAGDCLVGYLAASLSNKIENRFALNNVVSSIKAAMAASAIAITEFGAMASFPSLEEVHNTYPEVKPI